MTSSSAPSRPEIPASPRHVHLIAIAGVGMASLAGMLRAVGYDVTGSDQAVYPPMSTLLADLGIPYREGYRAENLEPRPDLVIVGNAMSRGNPEVEAMLTAGIPYCSMPEALMRFFMRDRRRAVVVGTHGKTTTSALLSWVLHETGGDPGFMVGGASRNFPHNFRLGAGPWFVAEGDEYDTAFFDKGPKFLHYDPDALLLNAIEFDHADIYRDLDHVKGAFRTLLERMRPGAVVAASADFPEVRAVVEASGRQAVFFGDGAGAAWRAEGVHDDAMLGDAILAEPGAVIAIRQACPRGRQCARGKGNSTRDEEEDLLCCGCEVIVAMQYEPRPHREGHNALGGVVPGDGDERQNRAAGGVSGSVMMARPLTLKELIHVQVYRIGPSGRCPPVARRICGRRKESYPDA